MGNRGGWVGLLAGVGCLAGNVFLAGGCGNEAIEPALAPEAVAADPARWPEPDAHEELESLAGLRDRVEVKKAYSIEALIDVLPVLYKQNYTFVYQSRGRHAELATASQPRVIVYGRTSRFIVSFHGTGTEVETVEFRKGDFTYRLLNFDGRTSPFAQPVEANPRKCSVCHGEPSPILGPRPFWGAYNMWPGAFGSISRNLKDFIALGTPEYDAYQTFLAQGRDAGRYALLPRAIAPKPVSPKEVNITNGAAHHPNGLLTNNIGEMNMYRIRNSFLRAPRLAAYKPLLVGLAQNCVDVKSETGLDAWFGTATLPATFPAVAARIKAEDDEDYLALYKRTGELNSDSASTTGGYRRLNIAGIKFFPDLPAIRQLAVMEVVAARMGIDSTGWTTEKDLGRHRLWNGTTLHSVDSFNTEGLGFVDPAMKKFAYKEGPTVFFPKYFGDGIPELAEFYGKGCAELKTLSAARLSVAGAVAF